MCTCMHSYVHTYANPHKYIYICTYVYIHLLIHTICTCYVDVMCSIWAYFPHEYMCTYIHMHALKCRHLRLPLHLGCLCQTRHFLAPKFTASYTTGLKRTIFRFGEVPPVGLKLLHAHGVEISCSGPRSWRQTFCFSSRWARRFMLTSDLGYASSGRSETFRKWCAGGGH